MPAGSGSPAARRIGQGVRGERAEAIHDGVDALLIVRVRCPAGGEVKVGAHVGGANLGAA